MDYGEARFIRTKRLKQNLLIIESSRTPGFGYKFMRKKDGQYECCHCKKLGRTRTVNVRDGRIVATKSPDDDHHENCRPEPMSAIEALDIDREMRHEVHTTGKRPRDAYDGAMSSITKKFKSSAEQEEVIINFPAFNEVRKALCRHRTAEHIPVPDPYDVPDGLRVTQRGRTVPADDPNHNERFLLHSGQNGRLLIFAADTELRIMHQSEYVISDGTFEMAPSSSYQLYTLHAFLREECLPVVWAVLPNKSTETYIEMFTAIREALVRTFGSVGSMRYFVTDFELAAINSIQVGLKRHFLHTIIHC